VFGKQAGVLGHLCNLLIHSSRLARGASHPAANPDPDWAFVSTFLDDDEDEYDSAALPPYPFLG
jgi:hypothetical protein